MRLVGQSAHGVDEVSALFCCCSWQFKSPYKNFTVLITLMFAGEMRVLGVFSECSCGSICRKEVDSPWSWLVCVCGTVIIALFFGVSLNFGILFPVLMDYFQETRERTGKFRTSQCWVSRGS